MPRAAQLDGDADDFPQDPTKGQQFQTILLISKTSVCPPALQIAGIDG